MKKTTIAAVVALSLSSTGAYAYPRDAQTCATKGEMAQMMAMSRDMGTSQSSLVRQAKMSDVFNDHRYDDVAPALFSSLRDMKPDQVGDAVEKACLTRKPL